MTADELHDILWLYWGQRLANGGVEDLEVSEEGSGVRVIARGGGRPEISLGIPRLPGVDLPELVMSCISHFILAYWMFKCQSCGSYYLRRGADVGEKREDDDLAVCDLCAERAAAAREALEDR